MVRRRSAARLAAATAPVLGLLACFGGGSTALAATNCSGTLTGPVSGPVIVSGATCTLDNAMVSGDVLVKPGESNLTSKGGTVITGSLIVTQGGNVFVNDTTITKEVRLYGKKGGEAKAAICAATIGGTVIATKYTTDVKIGDENPDLTDEVCHGPDTIGGDVILRDNVGNLQLSGSDVMGNVSVTGTKPAFDPTGLEGEIDLANNHIHKALYCKNNFVADDIPHMYSDLFDISGTVVDGASACTPPPDISGTPA